MGEMMSYTEIKKRLGAQIYGKVASMFTEIVGPFHIPDMTLAQMLARVGEDAENIKTGSGIVSVFFAIKGGSAQITGKIGDDNIIRDGKVDMIRSPRISSTQISKK